MFKSYSIAMSEKVNLNHKICTLYVCLFLLLLNINCYENILFVLKKISAFLSNNAFFCTVLVLFEI